MDKEIQHHCDPCNTMSLTGKGQINVMPDMAVIQLGALTTGENLKEVQSENALISQEILQAVKDLGVTDIKTAQYVIEKVYGYENDVRVEKGYSVRNIFEIKLSNIEQAGMVIDTAVEHGANVVQLISFQVSNPEFFYQQALNQAVMNAISKAQSIAMHLRVPLNLVPVKIVENSSPPIPYAATYNMREIAATPIEPGLHEIEASVTVEFIY